MNDLFNRSFLYLLLFLMILLHSKKYIPNLEKMKINTRKINMYTYNHKHIFYGH
jgi:hypothetical protein